MITGAEREWLTLKDAAQELGVSTITVQRWVKQGRLQAYRLGPRKVRLRRSDLSSIYSPVRNEDAISTGRGAVKTAPVRFEPLTEQQMEQGRRALELADSVIEMIRTRRKGIPLTDSADIIRQAREEQVRRTLDR